MSPAHTAPDQKRPDQKREAHIFLDMDGVIADLTQHGHTHKKFNEDGKLDYNSLDFDFWRTVPEFPGAYDFLNKLKKRGTVRFLTGPVPSPAFMAARRNGFRISSKTVANGPFLI